MLACLLGCDKLRAVIIFHDDESEGQAIKVKNPGGRHCPQFNRLYIKIFY